MEAPLPENKAARWALPALVFFAVLAAFSPCLDNAFVGWDDDSYLLNNPSFRGLGWTQLRWMLATRRFGLYQPLTWLSFGLDYKLWGLEPWGYHLTNILLHAAAAVLFYFVCRSLFEKASPAAGRDATALGAAIAALSFAVHPLRVEAVAWATARKDVLSGALLLACLWAYLEERIGPSLLLYALSLSAKATGLFLPVGLLVLDAYPLRRQGRLGEKIPYFLLAGSAAAATVGARVEMAETNPFTPINAAWRVGQIFYGLAAYPFKTLWPVALSPYYPPLHWFGTWFPQTAAFAALGCAAAWALWARRRRYPAVAAAAAWYALALAPVSGIFQHGVVYSIGDRFCYLPCLGWSALLGSTVLTARESRRRIVVAGVGLVLILWGSLSWRQTMIWRDSLTLWEHAGEMSPSARAFDNLAVTQGAAGRADQAVSSDRRALAIDPDYIEAYANLGLGLKSTGRRDSAEKAWRQGLSRAPNSALLQSLLGSLLCAEKKPCLAEGLPLLRRALAHGTTGKQRDDLAAALALTGDTAGAKREYEEALRADGEDAIAHVNLGLLLDAEGEHDAARGHYRSALRAREQRAAAHADWGNSLLAEGSLDQAARHYAEAIRIDPGLTPAQVNLGNILARSGRFAEAAARYRAALKKDPGSYEARANLSALRPALDR